MRSISIPPALWLTLLACFNFSSCEEVFDPSVLVSDPKLVVISQFEPQKKVIVRVSQTRSVVDPESIIFVDNASITIWEDSNLIAELDPIIDPATFEVYYSNDAFVPEEGIVYRLMVEAPGFEPVSAQSYIPERIPVSVSIDDATVDSSGSNYTFNLSVEFLDPGRSKNYYHLTIYQNITSEDGDLVDEQILAFDREAYNNRYQTTDPDGGLLFEDEPFDGQLTKMTYPFEVTLDPEKQRLGSTEATLRTVTEEYYLFQTSIIKQENSNLTDPLAEPTLLFNNIKNGHGIFAGYNSTTGSALFPL